MNENQRALWNGAEGAFWAKEQERYDRMLAGLGTSVLDGMKVSSGQRILAVGCGCDAMTVGIAERVGEDGYVVGLDISMLMLGRAREQLSSTQYQNIDLICADAETYYFPPTSFDAMVSRLGMTFFKNPPAAFANLADSLYPSGRLGFVCWQAPEDNEWMSLPWQAVLEHVSVSPPRATSGYPNPFALTDPERLHEVLRKAGFGEINIVALYHPLVIGTNIDDAVAFLCQSSIRRVLEQLPTDIARRIAGTLGQTLQAYVRSEGVVLGSAAWLVTAQI